MEKNDKILDYIKNEKDISRYTISTLERCGDIAPAKRRLISIEKEFINLPLENMEFEDLADVAAAISIYRTSRSLFYKSYNIEQPGLFSVKKDNLVEIIKNKIKFIKKYANTLMCVRVQELNLVQNSDFYYDFAKRQSIKNGTTTEVEARHLDSLSIQELLNIEPITIAKKRARAQAVIYSIGLYLLSILDNINIAPDSSTESLLELDDYLNNSIKNLKNNIYKYYNISLKQLPSVLGGTMGENAYIEKLHELQNVLSFGELKLLKDTPIPISKPAAFNLHAPKIGNILFGYKKAISTSPLKDESRNIQNKVFGILLPIPRRGNEKMTLLYKNITVDNINITHLFTNSFSNVKALHGKKERYFKGILMHPLWKLIDMAKTDSSARYMLCKLVDIDDNNFDNINFESPRIIDKINNVYNIYIEPSKDSVILAAKTRSEEDGLDDIFSIINTKISEIIYDYEKLLCTTNEILLK